MPPQPAARPLKVRYEPGGASEVLAFDSVEGDCLYSIRLLFWALLRRRSLPAGDKARMQCTKTKGRSPPGAKPALDSARGLS
jgi:hypothetical protein